MTPKLGSAGLLPGLAVRSGVLACLMLLVAFCRAAGGYGVDPDEYAAASSSLLFIVLPGGFAIYFLCTTTVGFLAVGAMQCGKRPQKPFRGTVDELTDACNAKFARLHANGLTRLRGQSLGLRGQPGSHVSAFCPGGALAIAHLTRMICSAHHMDKIKTRVLGPPTDASFECAKGRAR